MKRWKGGLLLCGAALLLALCGCDEGQGENQRIYRLAQRHAEARALAYVEEKYGIEARALGYQVQGSTVVFSFHARPEVVVPVAWGEEQFCVLLNLDDEAVGLDNRQYGEISRALVEYFLEQGGLPQPLEAEADFWARGSPLSSHAAWVGGKSYSTVGLVDFLYQGQSAKELLGEVRSLEYRLHFVDLAESLEDFTIRLGDWPSAKGFSMEAELFRYRDRESFLRFGGVAGGVAYYDLPTLAEHRSLSIRYDQPGEALGAAAFTGYRTAQLQGLSFTATLPFDPEACVSLSEEEPAWRVEKEGSAGVKISEYRQVSPLFWVPPREGPGDPDPEGEKPREGKITCILPGSYLAEHGEDLYVGAYNPQSGTVEVKPLYPSRGTPEKGTWAFSFQLAGTGEAYAPKAGTQYAILEPVPRRALPKGFTGEQKPAAAGAQRRRREQTPMEGL